MSAPPFAALQARLNRAVFARLSDVEAFITPHGALAAVAVVCIFHGAWAQPEGLAMAIASTSPALEMPTASVPPAWREAEVRIEAGEGAGSYTAVEHHPDGTGVSYLVLHKA